MDRLELVVLTTDPVHDSLIKIHDLYEQIIGFQNSPRPYREMVEPARNFMNFMPIVHPGYNGPITLETQDGDIEYRVDFYGEKGNERWTVHREEKGIQYMVEILVQQRGIKYWDKARLTTTIGKNSEYIEIDLKLERRCWWWPFKLGF